MTRTRSRDFRSDTWLSELAVTKNGLPISPPYNSPLLKKVALSGSSESITDVNHGRYYKNRGLVLGPMDLYRWSRGYASASLACTIPEWGGEVRTTEGDLIGAIEPRLFSSMNNYTSRDLNRMAEISLIKAYAKMKSSDVMSGETATDLGRTIGMLRHPFKASRDLCKKIAKGKARRLNKSASNAAQAFADSWLEYRYGWQPVILDVKSIVRESENFKAQSKQENLVVRASETRSGRSESSCTDASGLTVASGYYFTGTGSVNTQVRSSSGVIYDVSSRSSSEQADKILGSRNQDLVPLVWEKLPYSFVVDWFINVGDWLQAVVPDPFITVKGSWTTTVCQNVYEYVSTVRRTFVTSPLREMRGDAGSSTINEVIVKRVVNPQLPTSPVLLEKPLSVLHQADAAGLLCSSIIGALRGLKS